MAITEVLSGFLTFSKRTKSQKFSKDTQEITQMMPTSLFVSFWMRLTFVNSMKTLTQTIRSNWKGISRAISMIAFSMFASIDCQFRWFIVWFNRATVKQLIMMLCSISSTIRLMNVTFCFLFLILEACQVKNSMSFMMPSWTLTKKCQENACNTWSVIWITWNIWKIEILNSKIMCPKLRLETRTFMIAKIS